MGNIIFVIIVEGCGVLFLYLGFLLWRKGKIELIHNYHYKKVKEEEKKAYTGIMGKALTVTGIGLVVSGIMGLFDCSVRSFIPAIAAFVIGMGMMLYGQIKYNRGIF